MGTLSIDILLNCGDFLLRKGFQRQGQRRVTTWAILAAHAAAPSTHQEAQANAKKLLEVESPEKADIRNYHPCVALGVPAARRYFVDQGRINSLTPFQPACIDHMVDYAACSPDCVYGVLFEGQWVHEILTNAKKDRSFEHDNHEAVTGGDVTLTLSRRLLKAFRNLWRKS